MATIQQSNPTVLTNAAEPVLSHIFADKRTRLIWGAILLVAAAQIWLIYQKAINWDEFLHFGQIYALEQERFGKSLQSLHVRLFGWTTIFAEDVITQIQVARLAMLACVFMTAAGVLTLARKLVSFEMALMSGLVFLTAGYVFTNGFTYRPDPVAAAALIWALCFLADKSPSWNRVFCAGILVGFAGAMTIKSIFYAPCFAALAILWWRNGSGEKTKAIVRSAVIFGVALLSFVVIVAVHAAFLPTVPGQGGTVNRYMDIFLHVFEFEMIRYVYAQMIVAPLVTIGLLFLIPVAAKLPAETRILLAGLCAPLLCILFYRNTFPYLFTFLLPPVCVAIAPVVSSFSNRYGQIGVMGLAFVGPLILISSEPYGTLDRQRATIAEIERLYPDPTVYLSYSSYVPHYPRQIPGLISGVGLDRYLAERSGQFAEDIEAGKIAFVIATGDALNLVFNGDGTFQILPERDVLALQKNFLKHSDTIYILGRNVCSQSRKKRITLHRSGPYTVDGGDIRIDGRQVVNGETIALQAGTYPIENMQKGCVKLWALEQAPRLPADFPAGPIAGGY